MSLKQKTINSLDREEITIIKINEFLKHFVNKTLLLECHKLTIKKDQPILNKSKTNKHNWTHKGYVKPLSVDVYNFGFNLRQEIKHNSKTAFFFKYAQFTKDIQGKVYYTNGNIFRIVISCYGDKEKMLQFINFEKNSYKIINNYYRLCLASLNSPETNKALSGRIECSFQINSNKHFLEHIVSDEKYGLKIIAGSTMHGMSSSLPNIMLAAVGRRENFYNNFIIKFNKNSFRTVTSLKLNKLQKYFPDFPALHYLIDSEFFEDYFKVFEMSEI